jgi:hypothetical protein
MENKLAKGSRFRRELFSLSIAKAFADAYKTGKQLKQFRLFVCLS